MKRKYFEGQIKSNREMVRTVTLWSEKYYGVNAPIITGAGSIFFIENDWRDYLEVGQTVVLYDDLGGEDPMEVVSFGFNVLQNRTSIELDGAYSEPDHKSIRSSETNGFHPIFEPTILDIKTEWDRQGDEILAPIKSSYTTVSYANNDVWFDRFIDQYFQADDETLYLEVRIGSGSSTALEWVGNIVVDLIQWENSSKPRGYTFKATDGIDRLKGVTYDRAAGTLPGFDLASSLYTIKEHVFAALSANKLDQFWDTDDPYIRESCEYYSDLVTNWTDSKGLFDYSLLANSIFLEKDSSGAEPQYKTCYEVLEAICEMFSLRLVFSLGIYYFQQVRNFSSVDEIVAREYKKNVATASTRVTYPHHFVSGVGLEPILPMAGGMYGYFSGLAESRIDYYKYATLEVPMESRIRSVATSVTSLGQFLGGSGSGRTVAIRFQFVFVGSPTTNFQDAITLRFYLKNSDGDITHHVINNTNTGSLFWRVAPTTTDKGGAMVIARRVQANNNRLQFNFETSEIPDNGELFAEITNSNANNFIDQIRASIPFDDAGTTRRAQVLNETNKPFSKILEIKPLIITEEVTTTSSNTVTIWKNYPTAAKELQEGADEWAFPIGNATQRDTLSVNKVCEAMRLQFRPVEKYMGNWDSFYWPHQTIGYDGKIWVMNGMSRDYQMEEFSGEWFEMITLTDEAKDVIEDPRDIPIDPRQGNPERGFVLPYDKNRNLIDGEGKLIEVLPNQIGTFGLGDPNKYGVIEIPTTTDIVKIKKGDFIALIDPTTNAKIGDSFEVTKDVEEGDGKIEVLGQDFDAPIFQGAYLVFDEDKTQAATKTVRGGVLMTDANSIENTMSNLLDNQLVVYQDKIYFKSEGILFLIDGTAVV